MGQTLTHGIYLPDEGERNCYNGLASNWSILDGAVGTVAEHTTALAGKAPLVHTHTKSDITDFPVYGTTAGTICEGNDSRLSDARTPVAHTHTKSDVTDLFNSANTWSADQTTTGNLFIKSTAIQKGVAPSSNIHKNLYFTDKNGANIGVVRLRLSTGGGASYRMYGSTFIKDGQLDPTGTEFNWGFGQYLNPDGTTYFSFDGNIANNLIPTSSNYDLGSSTNKWKTLNGVNPGALSLPKIVAKNTANIASAIVGSDGETQYLDGTDNYYIAALDGWISVCISGFTQDNQLWITVYDVRNETWGTSAESSTSARNTLFIIFPIRANQRMRFRMKCTAVDYARFYPCEGNV